MKHLSKRLSLGWLILSVVSASFLLVSTGCGTSKATSSDASKMDAKHDTKISIVDAKRDAVSVSDAAMDANSTAKTVTIEVGPGTTFSPANITITAGETIKWVWEPGNLSYTVTSGTGALATNAGSLFDAPLNSTNTTFSFLCHSRNLHILLSR